MENSEFKPLSLIKELVLPEEELAEYYRKKRKHLYEQGKALKGIKWRTILHPLLYYLVKADRELINKQSLTILKDKSTRGDKPVIFAITHIGMYDFQVVSEAVKDHQFVFAGDPETTYRTFDGIMFQLNGVVLCDTDDKEDRYIAKETAKEVLARGKNLMIYPEGVWNLTPSTPVMNFFPGIIDIALESECDIIPIAIEQYDKDFIVNIGENFSVDSQNIYDRKSYINVKKNELRDIMATLKWEIWETMPKLDRSKIEDPEQIYEAFVKERLNEWLNPKTKEPYYSKDIIARREFHPKNIAFPNDVYSFMRKLKLTKENAFLFRQVSGTPKSVSDMIEENLEENRRKL